MTYNDELSQLLDFVSGEWEKMDLLFGAVKEDLTLKILRTQPDEKEKREEYYNIAQATDALAVMLQNCINECKQSNQGDN